MLDASLRTTENAELRELISHRIAAGPMTFREFMATALYHPKHGYYMSRRLKVGRDGDFLTSPEVHPAFGACVAKAIGELARALGSPAPLTIIEPGAGSGALAGDVIRGLASEGVDDVDYRIVETSPGLVALQEERLEGHRGVRWVGWDTLDEPSEVAIILSNELFDALPVHRVTVEAGTLREVYVAEVDGELADEVGPLSDPTIARYFDAAGVLPGEGCVAEVNLEAPALLRRLAGSFRRGVTLSFDYGYEASKLYAPWRRDGTLLCYYRHSADTDPYQRVGRQDLTAHVDWTALRRAGEEAGLTTAFVASQAEFLDAMGIGEALREPPSGHDIEEYFARRRGVSELIDPGGLGRVSLLAQYRGDEALGDAVRGFVGRGDG